MKELVLPLVLVALMGLGSVIGILIGQKIAPVIAAYCELMR